MLWWISLNSAESYEPFVLCSSSVFCWLLAQSHFGELCLRSLFIIQFAFTLSKRFILLLCIKCQKSSLFGINCSKQLISANRGVPIPLPVVTGLISRLEATNILHSLVPREISFLVVPESRVNAPYPRDFNYP